MTTTTISTRTRTRTRTTEEAGSRRVPTGKLKAALSALAATALLAAGTPAATLTAHAKESDKVTAEAVRAGYPAGAGDLGSLPGHTGTTSSAGRNAPGICDRTPAVRDHLMLLLTSALTPGYQGDCAGVTGEWLARLTFLELIGPAVRLTSLRRGDFARLANVRTLYITEQSHLTVLPPDAFDGLTGLEELRGYENGITTVSTGAFHGLPSLRELHLHDNRISRLEAGAFTGLVSLETLVLYRNRIEAFPFDELEALPALKRLHITDNPGHAHGVEVSPTSLHVPLGGSASYRLRLTAAPSTYGARVGPTPDMAVVGVAPGMLTFTQDDWFRSQEVTVSAPQDSPTGHGSVRHQVLDADYANRIVGPVPQVRLWIGTAPPSPPFPALHVADARTREGGDAPLVFTVTLDRAAPGEVTVDYATSDGTAREGEDYTRAAGTLTFAPGERKKTVPVAVLDDARDEGEESLSLTLSGASGARIARVVATGTITNDDELPKAWLARFGRTVAGQVVDAVGARLEGPASPHVTAGGIELGQARSGDTLRNLALAGGARVDSASEPLARVRSRAISPTAREVLAESRFHLRSEGTAGGPALSAWGRVATGGFDGEVDDTRIDGTVTTAIVGADVERGRMTAGAAVSYSRGDGEFAATGRLASDRERGEVESTLTSVHPYLRARLSERTAVWAMAGVGAGKLTLTEKGGTPIRTDIRMRMGAVGAKGTLVPAPESGGLELSVKSDAFWVRSSSDAVRSRTAGVLQAAEAEADATRVRLVLEGERAFALDGGGTLTPTIEMGARHDGGDAQTGAGFELGAGVRYATDRVRIEGSAHALVAHERRGYREWGASGSIRIDPGTFGRGVSLTVAPSVGATPNGVDRLWSLRDARSLARGGRREARSRLEAELGYGLRARAGRGAATPYTGLSLSEGGGREMRVGVRRAVTPDLAMGLEAARSDRDQEASGNALRAQVAMRW